MAPTLADGDVVLAVRALRPRRGDVAVVRHDGVAMVKRIDAAPGDEAMPGWILGPDEWLITGDNRSVSTDSRSFGRLGDADILARVVLTLRRGG
jgi:type IV secretory pathway protease TraF